MAAVRQPDLAASVARNTDCHDKAVAEGVFQLLKREHIASLTYQTRKAARQDVFEYIEMCYNLTHKHKNNGLLSPVDFQNRK